MDVTVNFRNVLKSRPRCQKTLGARPYRSSMLQRHVLTRAPRSFAPRNNDPPIRDGIDRVKMLILPPAAPLGRGGPKASNAGSLLGDTPRPPRRAEV